MNTLTITDLIILVILALLNNVNCSKFYINTCPVAEADHENYLQGRVSKRLNIKF